MQYSSKKPWKWLDSTVRDSTYTHSGSDERHSLQRTLPWTRQSRSLREEPARPTRSMSIHNHSCCLTESTGIAQLTLVIHVVTESTGIAQLKLVIHVVKGHWAKQNCLTLFGNSYSHLTESMGIVQPTLAIPLLTDTQAYISYYSYSLPYRIAQPSLIIPNTAHHCTTA